jgi:hypothetical protein
VRVIFVDLFLELRTQASLLVEYEIPFELIDDVGLLLEQLFLALRIVG